jgi:hypothetical protein
VIAGLAVRPIVTWPGTPTTRRVSSPFRARWSDTAGLMTRDTGWRALPTGSQLTVDGATALLSALTGQRVLPVVGSDDWRRTRAEALKKAHPDLGGTDATLIAATAAIDLLEGR